MQWANIFIFQSNRQEEAEQSSGRGPENRVRTFTRCTQQGIVTDRHIVTYWKLLSLALARGGVLGGVLASDLSEISSTISVVSLQFSKGAFNFTLGSATVPWEKCQQRSHSLTANSNNLSIPHEFNWTLHGLYTKELITIYGLGSDFWVLTCSSSG